MPHSGPSFKHSVAFFKETWFLGTPHWTTAQIPDLSGKVAIVTGGNSGLGKDTVRALLDHGARVYMASRDGKKALAAIEELYEETGQKAIFLQLELGDLKQVRIAATEFLSKEKRLDILYNNAGVVKAPVACLANGYDAVFHINVLAHFYFTKLLLPILISTASLSADRHVRVVNVSSVAHHLSNDPPMDFDTLKDNPTARQEYDDGHWYQQSKFAFILFSNELARRHGAEGIVSTAVHPGCFETRITTEAAQPWAIRMFENCCLFIYPARYGALTQLWAGTAPEASELNGKYIIPWGKVGVPHPGTDDTELATKLWVWLEEQTVDLERPSQRVTRTSSASLPLN